MDLKGKTALVTGGSRGLGRGIAVELARQGSSVYLNYISPSSQEKAESVVQEIKQFGRNSQAFKVNVADYKEMKTMVDKIIEMEGKIDFLVNNAGINSDNALMMMTVEEWQKVIDVNLTGTFNGCRAVIVPMMKQKYGKIVNMASVTGLIGMAGQTNYGASKAGIIGFTKCLAKEVAKYNITVNAVAPGFIQTEMVDKLKEEQLRREVILKWMAKNGLNTYEEVAKIVRDYYQNPNEVYNSARAGSKK